MRILRCIVDAGWSFIVNEYLLNLKVTIVFKAVSLIQIKEFLFRFTDKKWRSCSF